MRHLVLLMMSAMALGLAGPRPLSAESVPLAVAQAQDKEALATALVERLHATIVDTMRQGPALGFQGRYQRLAPVVMDSFSIERTARLITSPFYRDASPADREAVVEAIRRQSIANYAHNFNADRGQRFVTLGTSEGPRGTVVVETELRLHDGDVVPLFYLVEIRDGRPGILDILLNGQISQLSKNKADYRSLLESEGLGGLAREINARVEAMVSQ